MCDYAEKLGVNLDAWQRYVMDGLFSITESGLWAATEAGLLVSRQNGKGEILVAYDFAHLFLFPRADNRRKTILHSAHEVKTAIDGFSRLQGVVESQGLLMDRVEPRGIRIGNGSEGITLNKRKGQLNGDRIRFIARSKSSGRGFAGDTNVYDEAQEFSSSKRDALTYTQSAVPNPQELMTGTVPSEENDAEVFEGIRDRGRSGSGKKTLWMEWSPEHSENPKALLIHPKFPNGLIDESRPIIDLGSRKTWAESIPALNIRISDERVAAQVERATDIQALGRERFSIWANRPEDEVEIHNELDLEKWKNGSGEEYRVANPEVISIAVARSGAYATIGFGSRFDDERIAVTHKKTDKGTLWVPQFIADLKVLSPNALVVLDPKNATTLLTALEILKVKYLGMNFAEVSAAFATFGEMVNTDLVVHPKQEEVENSLQFAIPRAIGSSGFTWDASDPSKPITHAQAVTWATWGVLKLESAPPKDPGTIRGYA